MEQSAVSEEVIQLRNLPAFYGIRKFNTTFTRAC